jgi:hypothetical protein
VLKGLQAAAYEGIKIGQFEELAEVNLVKSRKRRISRFFSALDRDKKAFGKLCSFPKILVIYRLP